MLSSIYYQLKMNDKHDAIEAGTLNVDGLRCLISWISFRVLISPSQRLLPLQSKSPLHSLLRRPRRRRLLLSVSNPPADSLEYKRLSPHILRWDVGRSSDNMGLCSRASLGDALVTLSLSALSARWRPAIPAEDECYGKGVREREDCQTQ